MAWPIGGNPDNHGDLQDVVAGLRGFNVKDPLYGAKGDGVTDDTAAWQAAINAAAAQPKGGVVYIPTAAYVCGTLTLKQGVSIMAGKGATVTLKAGAGTFLIADQFATYAGSGNAWNGINGFSIEGLTINGNSANQTDSAAADYRSRNALIKLYGYNFTLRNLRLNDAKEISLYTEHELNWDGDTNANGQGFNQFAFGESTFENLYMKNYGVVGWVNRGPHDSHAKSVYISSYNISGLSAINGYAGQLNSVGGQSYGSNGLVADNLHVWGEHSDCSVLLDGANITQGKIYAEGASVAAIRIASGGNNSFDAVIDWAPVGVLLQSGNDNEISLFSGGNLTGSLVKISGNGAGNRFDAKHGGVYGTNTAMFDLSSGYTGGNNTFIANHPWAVTLFNGTPATTDRIDAVSDNYPDSSRVTRWELPVAATKVKIDSSGLDLGGLALKNAVLSGGSSAATLTVPVGAYLGDAFGGPFVTTLQPSNGLTYFTVLQVSATTTFNQITLNVATAGTTGSVYRAGVYADDGSGRPTGTALLDAGTAVATSAANITWTISRQLAPGLYHVGIKLEGSPTTAPKITGFNGAFPAGVQNGATPVGGWYANTQADGSLPVISGIGGPVGWRPAAALRVASRP